MFLRRNSLQRLSFIPVCAATGLTGNPMVAVVVSLRILAASPPARPTGLGQGARGRVGLGPDRGPRVDGAEGATDPDAAAAGMRVRCRPNRI